jgi:tetratricopeptide (TPR) repeat protein
MKYSFLFLLFFTTRLFSQNEQDSTERKVHMLINKIHEGTFTEEDRKEVKSLTYLIQNKSFVLTEGEHNYVAALDQSEKSLSIWIQINDTLNEANIRKYRGMLLGRLKRFDEAKAEIHQAERLFGSKNYFAGIAITQFDMAQMYVDEMRLDSAAYCAQLALAFWETKQDTFRILGNQTLLMRIYSKEKAYDKGVKTQEDARQLLQKKNLPWIVFLDFYFISAQLFEGKKEVALTKEYKQLYEEKIQSLQKGDFKPRSQYEENP